MRLNIESEEAQKTVVFLNGKPVNHFVAAEDGENGWVEIVDVEAMAPLYSPEDAAAKNWKASTANEHDAKEEVKDLDESELEKDPVEFADEDDEEWTPLKTKKVFGRVEFRRLG